MKCMLFPGSIINTVINEHGDQGSAPFMRMSSYCWRGKWWSVTFEGVCACVLVLACVYALVCVSPAGLTYSAISHWWHLPWPNIKDRHRSIMTVASNTRKDDIAKSRTGVTPKSLPSNFPVPVIPTIPHMFLAKKCMPRLTHTYTHTFLILTCKQSFLGGLPLKSMNLR